VHNLRHSPEPETPAGLTPQFGVGVLKKGIKTNACEIYYKIRDCITRNALNTYKTYKHETNFTENMIANRAQHNHSTTQLINHNYTITTIE